MIKETATFQRLKKRTALVRTTSPTLPGKTAGGLKQPLEKHLGELKKTMGHT